MKIKYMLAVVLVVVCFAARIGAGDKNGADAAARLAAIDARLVELVAARERLLVVMRTQLDDIEKVKAGLEKEDSECRRLRQRLRELDGEAMKIQDELEKRFAAAERYVRTVDTSRNTAAKLNAMVEEERRLGLEKRVLVGKQADGK